MAHPPERLFSIPCFQIELKFRSVGFLWMVENWRNLGNLSEQGENQQQTQPTYDAGSRIRTRATLVGGERSHHPTVISLQRVIRELKQRL